MKNQETMTKLPSPRSEEMYQILEEQANYYISIGDGDSVGGEIEGVEMEDPIYIEYDQENPNMYNVHYRLLSGDAYYETMNKAMAIMKETNDFKQYAAVMDSMYYSKDCYSVEELIETLNSIK